VISADTTVAQVLEEHPELLEFLAGYAPHFAHLRNRLTRRVMAPRVTVAGAARMAGVEPGELLSALRRAAGEPDPSPRLDTATTADAGAIPKPAVLASAAADCLVHLDVRDDVTRGEEPFARIMAAVKGLDATQVLVLRVPFEPLPLYDLLGRRGLQHWTEQAGARDWSVWFYRQAAPETSAPGDAVSNPRGRSRDARLVTIDVRGLEPPLPMVAVLERLDVLADDERLEVLHDRRPMFLYPQLEARGFVHETDEPGPGIVRILIGRRESVV